MSRITCNGGGIRSRDGERSDLRRLAGGESGATFALIGRPWRTANSISPRVMPISASVRPSKDCSSRMARRSFDAAMAARVPRQSEPNACLINCMMSPESVGIAPRHSAQTALRQLRRPAIPRERWLDSHCRPRMKGQDLRNRLGQESNSNPIAIRQPMNRQRRTAQPRPDHPLYRDVYQRLRAEILAGRLAAGARLPSSRTLSRQLGVARGTVEVAYQMLSGEGYTVADGARGTTVNPVLTRRRRASAPAKAASRAQRLRLPPGPLLFQMGLPALDVFPRKLWSQIAGRIVRSVDVEQLAHPHDVMGYEPLRHAIASYLRIARDIACTADQIMITAGFQGALGFVVQALLAPRDEVWVDDPGYFFAHELLRGAHLRLAPIPVDDEGLDVAAGTRIAPDAALAVVTPTHQFPLGMTLPVDRRLALLDWADRKRAFIVEDDYDC